MNNIKIEVEETKTYWQRMSKPLLIIMVVLSVSASVLTLILFFSVKGSLSIGSLFSAISFMFIFLGSVSFLSIDRYAKSCVTLFQIKDEEVLIKFSIRGRKKVIKGKLEDFVFVNRSTGRANLYIMLALDIKYYGNRVLSQGYGWEWEQHYSELTRELDKNNLLERGVYWWIWGKARDRAAKKTANTIK